MNEKDLEETLIEDEEIKEEPQEEKKKKLKPKEQIAELALENYELRESYLKSKAELENFKKRNTEERIRDRKYASSNLIADLLNPLDQLKKVVQMETDDKALKNFLIGFKMINDQLYKVLEEDGLEEIKALGEQFDPNYHYAVEKECNEELEDGVVTEVTQLGYKYKGRILRPAMVKVNEWSEEENE